MQPNAKTRNDAVESSPTFGHVVKRSTAVVDTESNSKISGQKQIASQRKPLVRERWFWITLASFAVLLTGLTFKDQLLPSAYQYFDFRASDVDGSVRIEWDKNSAFFRSARLALLDIKDGNEKQSLALTDEQLHHGNMTYVRKSEDVEIRMVVLSGRNAVLQRFVRLVSPPVHPAMSAAAPASAVNLEDQGRTSKPAASAASNSVGPSIEHDQVDEQVQQLKQELAKQTSRADRLQEVVRILQNRIEVEAARTSFHAAAR